MNYETAAACKSARSAASLRTRNTPQPSRREASSIIDRLFVGWRWNAGLEWMQTCSISVPQHHWPTKTHLWTIFPGRASDPALGFRQWKHLSSRDYINWLQPRLKVEIRDAGVHCGCARTLTSRISCTAQRTPGGSGIEINPLNGATAGPAGFSIHHSIDRGTKCIRLFQGGSVSPSETLPLNTESELFKEAKWNETVAKEAENSVFMKNVPILLST